MLLYALGCNFIPKELREFTVPDHETNLFFGLQRINIEVKLDNIRNCQL